MEIPLKICCHSPGMMRQLCQESLVVNFQFKYTSNKKGETNGRSNTFFRMESGDSRS
jgi:hypothetical protein